MTPIKMPEGSIFLAANEGRFYDLGTMKAIFKADEGETKERYCISEWWLEPHSEGPGAHLHEKNHDIFYVLEGIASILVGEEWINASKGAFILIPENTIHDFANRTDSKIGLLNFFIPGGFERNMPSIVKWFEENR
jgi:mannose-6-phosphate isomerase-like protein (cupin superfamily)